LLQNPYDIAQLTLGILLHYHKKLKIQIFCRCGRKRTTDETVNDFVPSQEDKPQTNRSVRYHGRQVSLFIGRLCPRLFVRTCIWNVSRGSVHRSWQTQAQVVLLARSALIFCFRRSHSMPLTLFSLRTRRCSRSLHLTIDRTKSVAELCCLS